MVALENMFIEDAFTQIAAKGHQDQFPYNSKITLSISIKLKFDVY